MKILTSFTNEPVRSVEKPNHKREKKTAKQRGNISPSVARKVDERANDHCEWCGRHKSQVWGLQRAHLVRRWKLDQTTEYDVAKLCGPSVNSGTCHWKVDYTKSGRDWAENYRKILYRNARESG